MRQSAFRLRGARCLLNAEGVLLEHHTIAGMAKARDNPSEYRRSLPDTPNHSRQSLGGAPAMGQGRRDGAPRAALRCARASPERGAVQRLHERCGCRGACTLLGRCKAARWCGEASLARGRRPCWERAAEAQRARNKGPNRLICVVQILDSLSIVHLSASVDMPAASVGAVHAVRCEAGGPPCGWCHCWQRGWQEPPSCRHATHKEPAFT